MKGNPNSPTFTSHLELHAALVSVVGTGKAIPRRKFNAYIMERTGVGVRQSVQRYLEAWEDLGLIEAGTWKSTKASEGSVILKAAPAGLALPRLEPVLATA